MNYNYNYIYNSQCTCLRASFSSLCARFCLRSRRSSELMLVGCWFLGGRPRFLLTGAWESVVLLAFTDPTSSIIFLAWRGGREREGERKGRERVYVF